MARLSDTLAGTRAAAASAMPEHAGRSGGVVVAVLGYSRRGETELHPICAERLAHAQRLATGARAVIVSGWSRPPTGMSEAERMRAAWRGPDVALVSDPDARSTAANAANVAAAASALGADELVVVTSRWHRPRASILLRTALRGSGLRLKVEGAGGPAPIGGVARELVCLALLPFQLAQTRAARTQLVGARRGPSSGSDTGPASCYVPRSSESGRSRQPGSIG